MSSGYWAKDWEDARGCARWRWVKRPWWQSGSLLVALEVAGLLAIAAWGWLAP